MSDRKTFDPWLKDDGPAALVIRQPLMPVEGHDGILFPATFAAAEDKRQFAGGYNIDSFPDGKNVCLVDSVGAQANRIEPMFAAERYARLIPQVVVKAGDKSLSLLEAGHRAGDAIVRCSALQKELREAFTALLSGNAEPLAKIAPTSLVFGVWDSRDTQAKWPRLVSSTIRAFDVRKLTRSAQYVPAAEYVARGLLTEPRDKKVKDAYAERGFIHIPASGAHGGVIATGGVRRDATLSIAALRRLNASDEKKTLMLRRYVLGLALTAFTATPASYLRQGCNLVPDVDKPSDLKLVHADGRREDTDLTHADALAYATIVANDFGVGTSRTVDFDKKLAERDVRRDATIEPAGRVSGRGRARNQSEEGM